MTFATYFRTWKNCYGKSDGQLAEYLGIDSATLETLTTETIPPASGGAGWRGESAKYGPGPFVPDVFGVQRIAEHYGTHPDHLIKIVSGE